MTKITWGLLGLLVLSNAAWLLHDSDEPTALSLFDEDTPALERKIDELEALLARHRDEGPLLIGRGEARPDSTPPSTQADGTDAEPMRTTTADEAEAAAQSVKDAEARKAKQAALPAAREAATTILRKVLQVEDPDLRAEGLLELATALQGDDELLVEFALSSLYSARNVEFDRSTLAGIVTGLLDSENGGIRRSALYALHAVAPDEVGADLLIQRSTDPDPRVRGHVARLLAITEGKTFVGQAGETLLTLLGDDEQTVRRGTLRALWDADYPAEVEERLIAMSAEPGPEGRETIYYALSTMPRKSRPVVETLVDHLTDEDKNVRARAHWGLQRGVPEEHRFYVAEQYMARIGKFVSPASHREALKLIVKYGDETLAPDLERFAANEMVEASVRDLANRAAQHLIENKPR